MRIGSLDFVPGSPLLLMAGPCVLEDDKTPFEIARQLRDMTGALGMPFVFKASYDKANRTSVDAFRGPGPEEGLALLGALRDEVGVPVMTDVHEPEHCAMAVGKVDMLQIPAFLCRQTDLLLAAGHSGLAVNIKKGQFLAPWDIEHCLNKVRSTGNEHVCVTDRGYSFGYNALVSDMRAIPQMKHFGVPVVFDATHSVQQPGGAGASTSGDRSMAPILARSAVAAGADAIFAETHPDPDQAKSDGPNMIPLGELAKLLGTLQRVQAALRED